MAWKRVEKYYLGYGLADKRFYFYYKLQDENVVHQFFPSAEAFIGLSDMFRNEGPISFNTERRYFVTAPEGIGEGESAT